MKILKVCLVTLFSIKNSYYYSMTKNINGILQINGSYSVLQYDTSYDPLRYGTKARRKVKYSYHKKGLIEDHHLIPKEFDEHHLFDDINFHVGCSNNIYILPSVAYRESIFNKNINLFFPRSHCVQCSEAIRPKNLIPIFSFLLQKGECDACKEPISLMYPLNELLHLLVGLLLYFILGLNAQLFIAYLVFFSFFILFILDYKYFLYQLLEQFLLVKVLSFLCKSCNHIQPN